MDFDREEHRWYALIVAALAISAVLLLWKHSKGSDAGRQAEAVVSVEQNAAPQPAPSEPKPSTQSKSGPASAAPSKPPAPELPSGAWGATGVVVWVPSNVISSQPRGSVLKRPWEFDRVCQGSCRIVFTRGTLYGPSVTTLLRHGQRFTAHFPPVQVPCSYPTRYSGPRHPFGESHDSYALWWSEQETQLRAIEHRTETGCYPTSEPPDVTRWRASRISRGAF